MDIDLGLVEKIAQLANIRLSEDEKTDYQAKLCRVLGYMATISSFEDGHGVEEREEREEALVGCRERSDSVEPSLQPDQFLEEAPHRADSFFVVPKIIE